MERKSLTVFAMTVALTVSLNARAEPQLTDDQRIDLYNRCEAKQGFDVVGFASWIGSALTGDVAGLAQPFVDGYKQQGCDVFLTDRQKARRAHAEYVNQRNRQEGPGVHIGSQ